MADKINMKERRAREHRQASDDYSDAVADLIRAQENAYNANINDINTWINTMRDSVEPCSMNLDVIANISTRITELAGDIPSSSRRYLGETAVNKLYARIEQAETNLMDMISEIDARCIIRKR